MKYKRLRKSRKGGENTPNEMVDNDQQLTSSMDFDNIPSVTSSAGMMDINDENVSGMSNNLTIGGKRRRGRKTMKKSRKTRKTRKSRKSRKSRK
jgi:hypothetical protein